MVSAFTIEDSPVKEDEDIVRSSLNQSGSSVIRSGDVIDVRVADDVINPGSIHIVEDNGVADIPDIIPYEENVCKINFVNLIIYRLIYHFE